MVVVTVAATKGTSRQRSSSTPLSIIPQHAHDGGAETLLWYIFYNQFVLGEESRWFPYLDILPSIEDLKRTHPLFMEAEMPDYLAGSDVRMIIQDEKQRALEIFEEASQDKKFVKAFGANRITRDNVFWAYIIVHSRSIWWHGKLVA